MEFEFEVRLKDGRTVNVVGAAEITYHCDCGDETHDHIDAIEIESAVLVVNDGADEWLEIEQTAPVLREIEDKVEDLLYTDLAGVA